VLARTWSHSQARGSHLTFRHGFVRFRIRPALHHYPVCDAGSQRRGAASRCQPFCFLNSLWGGPYTAADAFMFNSCNFMPKFITDAAFLMKAFTLMLYPCTGSRWFRTTAALGWSLLSQQPLIAPNREGFSDGSCHFKQVQPYPKK